MHPGYEQDKAHADVMDFTFKVRIYKLLAVFGGFVAGAFFIPMMAVWDCGADALIHDFNRGGGFVLFLYSLFALCGILTSIVSFMFVRGWEYRYAPKGYEDRIW